MASDEVLIGRIVIPKNLSIQYDMITTKTTDGKGNSAIEVSYPPDEETGETVVVGKISISAEHQTKYRVLNCTIEDDGHGNQRLEVWGFPQENNA